MRDILSIWAATTRSLSFSSKLQHFRFLDKRDFLLVRTRESCVPTWVAGNIRSPQTTSCLAEQLSSYERGSNGTRQSKLLGSISIVDCYVTFSGVAFPRISAPQDTRCFQITVPNNAAPVLRCRKLCVQTKCDCGEQNHGKQQL